MYFVIIPLAFFACVDSTFNMPFLFTLKVHVIYVSLSLINFSMDLLYSFDERLTIAVFSLISSLYIRFPQYSYKFLNSPTCNFVCISNLYSYILSYGFTTPYNPLMIRIQLFANSSSFLVKFSASIFLYCIPS
ncbi:putative membrane protein [Clostridioides difficile DA00165]|nr:putative membrane protein [Clostridioides difficile DA00165]